MFYIHKSKFEYQEVGGSIFDIYFLLTGPMFTKGEVRQAYNYFCVAGHPHTHVIVRAHVEIEGYPRVQLLRTRN